MGRLVSVEDPKSDGCQIGHSDNCRCHEPSPASSAGGVCGTGRRQMSGTGCTASCCVGCELPTGSTEAGRAWTARFLLPKGSDKTEPNPTDRGWLGTKRHLAADRNGMYLAFLLTGVNTNDSMPFEESLDSIPATDGKAGRRRRRLDKFHADKAFDHRRCPQACRRRGIAPRVARRGVGISQKLGRHRWVIERAFAWINRFRRLVTRYERRSDIHHALTTFACSLICFNKL